MTVLYSSTVTEIGELDIHATSPAGPLAMFITEDLLVTGVKLDNINPA